MMILIAGGSGSGKSRFAEELCSRLPGERVYIATMVSQSRENELRIQKHRRQRAGLGFRTVEEPRQVGDVPLEPDSVVLLEDVSNLLANLIFSANGSAEQALAEIQRLNRRCGHLVAVTISGLSAEGYEGETADYIHALNRLNEDLLALADAAAEMQDGRPVIGKGSLHDLF